MSIYYGILYESVDGETKAQELIQQIVMKYMRKIDADNPEIKQMQTKMLNITHKKNQPETASPAAAPQPYTPPAYAIASDEEKPAIENFINMAKPGSFSWFLREGYEHGVTPGDWLVIMSKPKKGLTAGMTKEYVHFSRPSEKDGQQVISTSYKMSNIAGVATVKAIMTGQTIPLQVDPKINMNLFGGRMQKYAAKATGQGGEQDKKKEPTGLYADFAKDVENIRKEPEHWQATSPDVAKYGTKPSTPAIRS